MGEKRKKLNYIQYLNKLRSDRFNIKKSILYYYDGIRDDKIPKRLIPSFNRTNYFSEKDKEVGLKKLNEFLTEYNMENSSKTLEENTRSRIEKRNLDIIHEIEERNKSGIKDKPKRCYTPRKIKKVEDNYYSQSSNE